jgi:hypothetical protein
MLTLLFEYSFSKNPKAFKKQTEIIAKKLIELDYDSFSPQAFYDQNNYIDYKFELDTDNHVVEEIFDRLLLFSSGSGLLGDELFKLCLFMGVVIYEPTDAHKAGMKAEKLRLFTKGIKNSNTL